MIISDLSYLNEIAEESVQGGYGGYDYKFKKKIDVNIDVDVKSKVNAKGAYAEFTFDNTALGKEGSGVDVEYSSTAVKDGHDYVSLNSGNSVAYAL